MTKYDPQSFSEIPTDVPQPVGYKNGGGARGQYIEPERRPFIAWDGEGMNLSGPGKPQKYVLFGCSTGQRISDVDLTTFEILDFIIKIGEENPTAWHVGFAFTYDANMIVRSLHARNLKFLHENGFVRLRREDGSAYVITMRRGKWLAVTRRAANWDRELNPHAAKTVRIFDIFGFFTCSFIKAYEDLVGPVPEIIRSGKAARKDFTWGDLPDVTRYWEVEVVMLRELADELRKRMYGAGLRIKSWHGPGALATFAMNQHGIKKHMRVNDESIRTAARYAYAGGRFELFKVGRVVGPIYSYDINSAYPYGIAQVPSMAEGDWVYELFPARIAKFGVYHVRMRTHVGFDKPPSPLFHRDDKHNISYPWHVEGWYWGPEVHRLLRSKTVEILEGYHYVGARTKPFAWVEDMYEQRREWKRKGYPTQLALKLCMNSLYGKMAQRIGWDEKRGRIPPWHQLEWAGWVTANTRAMLYEVMRRIPFPQLIAVETDGIYTTKPPDELGIESSAELGGWEIETYDEIMYVQSGLAWLRKGDKWIPKRRGLDADTFTREQCETYLRGLQANEPWPPFVGKTTRFIGLGAALNSSAPVKIRHCVWETTDREISPGERGKRIHVPTLCDACKAGLSAYDAGHDLVIRSLSMMNPMSTPHNIPWEAKDDTHAEWREWKEANV